MIKMFNNLLGITTCPGGKNGDMFFAVQDQSVCSFVLISPILFPIFFKYPTKKLNWPKGILTNNTSNGQRRVSNII